MYTVVYVNKVAEGGGGGGGSKEEPFFNVKDFPIHTYLVTVGCG